MRSTEYEFVTADSSTLLTSLIAKYETLTGRTLNPADPDRLFIAWVADIIISEKVNTNYIANQNIPSRAEGENLDALGQWIYNLERNPAQPAKCTVRFNISSAQASAISIPSGTRVTDISQSLVWETTADALIAIGSTYADVMVQCQTDGTVGNGYAVGQINTLIDVDNILYFSSCSNTGISDGGSDEEDDEDYYARARLSLDAYSTAGAEGSYIYWAKSVSDEIADVKAICPKETRTGELTFITDENSASVVFLGGDGLDTSTLIVYPHGSSTAATLTTDYTVSYTNGLLKITKVAGGGLASATSIDYSIKQIKAGNVYLYALMNDGTIANSTIKTAIATACNASTVRPLTDKVTVQDPSVATYNINLTYYIPNDSVVSLTEIQTAVTNAVNEYKVWQCEKLGRDINPSKLWFLLMQTGIKRAVITSPTYQVLSSGDDGSAPQIASVGTVTITNGGYEDE